MFYKIRLIQKNGFKSFTKCKNVQYFFNELVIFFRLNIYLLNFQFRLKSYLQKIKILSTYCFFLNFIYNFNKKIKWIIFRFLKNWNTRKIEYPNSFWLIFKSYLFICYLHYLRYYVIYLRYYVILFVTSGQSKYMYLPTLIKLL